MDCSQLGGVFWVIYMMTKREWIAFLRGSGACLSTSLGTVSGPGALLFAAYFRQRSNISLLLICPRSSGLVGREEAGVSRENPSSGFACPNRACHGYSRGVSSGRNLPVLAPKTEVISPVNPVVRMFSIDFGSVLTAFVVGWRRAVIFCGPLLAWKIILWPRFGVFARMPCLRALAVFDRWVHSACCRLDISCVLCLICS